MKRFLLITIITSCIATSSFAQGLYSPYVENRTLTINNSGFKPAALRTTKLTTPTPMHVQTDPINATVSPRFQVAKADLALPLNWALANGWLPLANSTVNGISATVIPKGCASYSETGAPVGVWRVPTQRELFIINIAQHELEAQNISGYNPINTNQIYWTGTQRSATQAWALSISAVSMYIQVKTKTAYVRCIRDL